jgi:hypothetical protein
VHGSHTTSVSPVAALPQKNKASKTTVDDLCSDFCQRYLSTCQSANEFVNPDLPRGSTRARRRRLDSLPDIDAGVKQRILEHLETRDDADSNTLRRRLIAGSSIATADEMFLDNPRLEGNVFDDVETCQQTCMTWPRPISPRKYVDPPPGGITQQPADTFWCREEQLKLAEQATSAPNPNYAAQVYCPRAGPDGDGFCFNVFVNASQPYVFARVEFPFPGVGVASPYEFLRAGADTGRHLGYCRIYYNDEVADCTNAGIDDRTLDLALALLPGTIRILILSNNVGKWEGTPPVLVGSGITVLSNRTFANLLFPSMIQAVFIDDGNIDTIEPLAFGPLANVEVISLNNQNFMSSSLSSSTFRSNQILRDVSIANYVHKIGKLGPSIDAQLFRRNPFLQRVVISGHPNLISLPERFFEFTFEGQFTHYSEMGVLILSNNGFVDSGISPLMFEAMDDLRILDLSGNEFQTVKKAWFSIVHPTKGLPWSSFGLYKVFFHDNPINIIEDNAFDDIFFLEQATFHNTNVITVPVNFFKQAFGLISYTLSAITS